MNPTDEQLLAIEKFSSGRSLAIEAGAGTGKTSTLELIANSTNGLGQYVAFNKSIVTEAGEKMPNNVACSTAHSLAFRAVGKKFARRLSTAQRMRSNDIALYLGLDPLVIKTPQGTTKRLSPAFLAGLAMRAATRFCQSEDLEPTRKHVPYVEGVDELVLGERLRGANNKEIAKHIESSVKKIWADARDVNGHLPYKHDYYLKLWQISDPKINSDFIMFDEAQDANPVMSAIVSAQKHAQLVWVGDSQQQIYSFTGAINALQRIEADDRVFLTQSFRFGQGIADIANEFLEALDAELRLTGLPSLSSYIGEIDNPEAVLTRTNATAVETVLQAHQDGRLVHLMGGGREVVSFARAAGRLMQRQSVDHPDLACFDSWDEVLEYVSQDQLGSELRLLVKLVHDFGVETIIGGLERTVAEKKAELIVSTAHKAKGREWSSVKTGGDFMMDKIDDEEQRLRYVTVTRAKHELDHTSMQEQLSEVARE